MVAALTAEQIKHLNGDGYASPFGSLARELAIGTRLAAIEAELGVADEAGGALAVASLTTTGTIAASGRVTTTDGVASGTARVVGGVAASLVAASTAITGTTETEANFDTTYSMPANSLKVGTRVRIRATGIFTATTGTETLTLLVKLGTVTLAVTGNIDPATNDIFRIDFEFVVRSVGATGTVVGDGLCQFGARAAALAATGTHLLATGSAGTSTATVDTTVANIIAIAIDRQATATDGDSARLDRMTVDVTG